MPELVFKGKEFVFNHHLAVPFRPLVPVAEKSIGEPRLDGNLIIHGDNLHALKALLPTLAGQVDCIVIDPPYNTGNERWCYNDNVNSPMIREWLSSNPVSIEDGARHDKWCAMMYPRLRLLRELLSDEGIIAVAIDDNELDRLLCLMDEVFGASNRQAVAVWRSDPSGGKQKAALRIGHEYVVVYGGGAPDLTRETKEDLALDLEDGEGAYAKGRELIKWGAGSLREDRRSMHFPLRTPDGSSVLPIRNDGREGRWRLGQGNPLMQRLAVNPDTAHWEMRPFDANVVVNGETERWMPYEKIRAIRRDFGWSSWLDAHGTNADGSRLLKEIFGGKVFDTPKPLSLIEWILCLCANTNAIVLDSFAGSGTTAHAVLSANDSDDGNRRFILVECEEYADSLTAERVRRVIGGYDFSGTQREELYRHRLTFRSLGEAGKILSHVAHLEERYAQRFDRIKKVVKNGELLVLGEKAVSERAEGLAGNFTFCTLGPAIDLDRLLRGEDLPSFVALGSVLFNMATSEPHDPADVDLGALGLDGHGCLGEAAGMHVWLFYKPDLHFLKSAESALTLEKAFAVAKARPGKRHVVFAPARFVSQKMLSDARLPVEFAPLPFALYRVERG